MSSRANVGRAALVLIAVSAGSTCPAQTGQKGSWEGYRILSDRNIFMRDRRAPRRPERETYRPPPEPRPVADDSDASIVLTGVACGGSQYVAFFENTRTGEFFHVLAGGDVGKGKLTGIDLDAIEYDRDGKKTKVEMGRSLTGVVRSILTEPAPTTRPAGPPAEGGRAPSGPPGLPPDRPSSAGATSAPASTGGSNLNDILERMRRRREQEMNR